MTVQSGLPAYGDLEGLVAKAVRASRAVGYDRACIPEVGAAVDIHSYRIYSGLGGAMTLIHVRRVGNSSVVTLPQDVMEQANLQDGDLVQPRVDSKGRVVLDAVAVTPRERRREIIRNAARRERPVLQRLAEHDRQ
ncbi:MAG: hypothetical protein Q7S25_00660 [Candidatus Limnocylindria bacterium]|nr:hypothetical protein [Candidatus Limnocylindria bacterium]